MLQQFTISAAWRSAAAVLDMLKQLHRAMPMQGRLIALFTSDAQVIMQATSVLPLVAFVMVRSSSICTCSVYDA